MAKQAVICLDLRLQFSWNISSYHVMWNLRGTLTSCLSQSLPRCENAHTAGRTVVEHHLWWESWASDEFRRSCSAGSTPSPWKGPSDSRRSTIKVITPWRLHVSYQEMSAKAYFAIAFSQHGFRLSQCLQCHQERLGVEANRLPKVKERNGFEPVSGHNQASQNCYTWHCMGILFLWVPRGLR